MDFSPEAFAELRRSVDLESRSDLMAAAGDFGEASRLMKEANEIRRRMFGQSDPNWLREITLAALNAGGPG